MHHGGPAGARHLKITISREKGGAGWRRRRAVIHSAKPPLRAGASSGLLGGGRMQPYFSALYGPAGAGPRRAYAPFPRRGRGSPRAYLLRGQGRIVRPSPSFTTWARRRRIFVPARRDALIAISGIERGGGGGGWVCFWGSGEWAWLRGLGQYYLQVERPVVVGYWLIAWLRLKWMLVKLVNFSFWWIIDCTFCLCW